MDLEKIKQMLPEGVTLEEILPLLGKKSLSEVPPEPLSPSDLEYECTGCRRIYKGKAINSSEPQKRRFVGLCPRCWIPNEKLWWLHHYLDLEEVIDPT